MRSLALEPKIIMFDEPTSALDPEMIFMDHGKIVEQSPVEEFFAAPRSERAQEFLNKILVKF
mgnify:CR=1 FL=1